MTTTNDYSQLKECAEKATQGEWWIDSHGHTLVAHTEKGTVTVFRTDSSMGPATRHAETGNLSHWRNDWDASYIVTAQPSTVRALLKDLETTERRLATMEVDRDAERDMKARARRQRNSRTAAVEELSAKLDEEHALRLEAERQVEELRELLNTPHTHDWIEGVKLEAGHQIQRWGVDHDAGKEPADWFWLIGYLAQKAMIAQMAGDEEKAKHHTISTSAAMLNWFRAITGESKLMRPGINPTSAEGKGHE